MRTEARLFVVEKFVSKSLTFSFHVVQRLSHGETCTHTQTVVHRLLEFHKALPPALEEEVATTGVGKKVGRDQWLKLR